jgi:hypothetical protein
VALPASKSVTPQLNLHLEKMHMVIFSFQVKKRNTTTQDPAPGRSGAKRRKVDNKEVRRKNDKYKGK